MKRYESYKDSGVKWLGEIPGHWDVKRLGSFFIERRVKVSDKDFAPLSVTKNGIFPQLENVAKSNDGDNRKLVRANDFVINSRSDRKGSSGVSSFDGSVSLINIVLKPRNTVYPTFCNYLLKSIAFIEEYYRNGRGIVADLWTTRFDEMKIIKLAMPPKAEQTAIANYLDSVTSKIDEAISQQQKMIDLLNERKQIIIQNAVTKGLDPNAKIKDSGVEWIGEIPEDWEVRRIKNSCKIINKKSTDNLPYIELDNIESKSGKLLSYSNNRPDSICNHFDKGDILFCKLRPYLAKCIITGVEGKCSSELLVLRHFLGDQKYFQYLLLSPKLIDLINESTYGAKMPRANWSYIGNCIIPIPSLEEQKSIINFLDSFTSYIDSSISQCNKMISLLQERKQIIINDAVIGKIKVV